MQVLKIELAIVAELGESLHENAVRATSALRRVIRAATPCASDGGELHDDEGKRVGAYSVVFDTMIVVQYRWAAVKKCYDEDHHVYYDVWHWNVWKMKWTRMTNSAAGYGSIADAKEAASKHSMRIEAMLANNKQDPPALVEAGL